jgi:ribosomal protein S8
MSYVNAPIHDLLIRIKNAYMARRKTLTGIVYSRYKENVLTLLQKYKFIHTYKVISVDNKKFIELQLVSTGSMKEDVPVVKFYSTPSRKWYL